MAKKTFQQLYEDEKQKPTAAQLFIQKVAEITHRKELTVRMWLSGRQTPDELAQSIIAKEFNVSVDDLFPKMSLS